MTASHTGVILQTIGEYVLTHDCQPCRSHCFGYNTSDYCILCRWCIFRFHYEFFFFLSFWRTHVLFGGHWYPFFGFLVTCPLGFKARVGCLIRIAEANVMYIPRDPPLVLHLLTSWQPARSQSCPHILLQRWGCWDLNSCSQNICEPDPLPTELNRDRLLWNIR